MFAVKKQSWEFDFFKYSGDFPPKIKETGAPFPTRIKEGQYDTGYLTEEGKKVRGQVDDDYVGRLRDTEIDAHGGFFTKEKAMCGSAG